MKNIGQMMKQAQQMQARMEEMQQRLDQMLIEGMSGGGLVKVWVSGKGELKKIKIDPSLVNPQETEVLEDLILAAVNDAKRKVDQTVADETEKIMGGLQLPPGIKLPF